MQDEIADEFPKLLGNTVKLSKAYTKNLFPSGFNMKNALRKEQIESKFASMAVTRVMKEVPEEIDPSTMTRDVILTWNKGSKDAPKEAMDDNDNDADYDYGDVAGPFFGATTNRKGGRKRATGPCRTLTTDSTTVGLLTSKKIEVVPPKPKDTKKEYYKNFPTLGSRVFHLTGLLQKLTSKMAYTGTNEQIYSQSYEDFPLDEPSIQIPDFVPTSFTDSLVTSSSWAKLEKDGPLNREKNCLPSANATTSLNNLSIDSLENYIRSVPDLNFYESKSKNSKQYPLPPPKASVVLEGIGVEVIGAPKLPKSMTKSPSTAEFLAQQTRSQTKVDSSLPIPLQNGQISLALSLLDAKNDKNKEIKKTKYLVPRSTNSANNNFNNTDDSSKGVKNYSKFLSYDTRLTLYLYKSNDILCSESLDAIEEVRITAIDYNLTLDGLLDLVSTRFPELSSGRGKTRESKSRARSRAGDREKKESNNDVSSSSLVLHYYNENLTAWRPLLADIDWTQAKLTKNNNNASSSDLCVLKIMVHDGTFMPSLFDPHNTLSASSLVSSQSSILDDSVFDVFEETDYPVRVGTKDNGHSTSPSHRNLAIDTGELQGVAKVPIIVRSPTSKQRTRPTMISPANNKNNSQISSGGGRGGNSNNNSSSSNTSSATSTVNRTNSRSNNADRCVTGERQSPTNDSIPASPGSSLNQHVALSDTPFESSGAIATIATVKASFTSEEEKVEEGERRSGGRNKGGEGLQESDKNCNDSNDNSNVNNNNNSNNKDYNRGNVDAPIYTSGYETRENEQRPAISYDNDANPSLGYEDMIYATTLTTNTSTVAAVICEEESNDVALTLPNFSQVRQAIDNTNKGTGNSNSNNAYNNSNNNKDNSSNSKHSKENLLSGATLFNDNMDPSAISLNAASSSLVLLPKAPTQVNFKVTDIGIGGLLYQKTNPDKQEALALNLTSRLNVLKKKK